VRSRSPAGRRLSLLQRSHGLGDIALKHRRILPVEWFDTKIAVVLDHELAVWQKANVTAFLVSGIAATDPEVVGDHYIDASGNRYRPMLRQPVMVYAVDAAGLRRAYERAMARGVERLSA
jgi:hypothetical protein